MTESVPSKIKKGVSVIICCYNSALRLPQTLRHLSKQIFPTDFFIEIIVVNNASTDNTVAVAGDILHSFKNENTTCRLIDEPRPGQMFARKRGVAEASFECIVFCDDDNWLVENYILLSYQMISSNPSIGAGGGQNLPVTNADVYPEWFDEYKNYYGMGIPADISGDVSYKTYVLGAGMVTRKSLFLKIFDEKYPTLLQGRDGRNLSTGDDFEYCKRLLLWGYELYYEQKMILHHFVPKERLSIEYRERLMRGISEAGLILNEYDLAIRVYKKNRNKNKFRLLFLSPFRILFTKLGLSKRVAIDEWLTFLYLSPFQLKNDHVKSIIKKFIHHK